METMLQPTLLMGNHDTLYFFPFNCPGRRWLCNEQFYFLIHTYFFLILFLYTLYFSQVELIDSIASSWTHSKGRAGAPRLVFTDGMPPSPQP